MKTYWDHSDQERANLTYEEVQDLLKFELMEQGVIRPTQPELLDETPPPIATKKFYKVSYRDSEYGRGQSFGCLFRTAEQAESFMALLPAIEGSHWQYDGSYFKAVDSMQVEVVQLPTEADQLGHRPKLIELKANADKNRKAKDEYEKAVTACNSSCEKIWNDWHRLHSVNSDNQKIVHLWEQYLDDCDGEEDIATRFLLKAHDHTAVADAFEWFGMASPIGRARPALMETELVDSPP